VQLEVDEEDVSSDEDSDNDFGEATARIAVKNCDWTRMRAVDLLAIFQSFTPPGGIIKSVTVYVSDFGKEQMKKVCSQAASINLCRNWNKVHNFGMKKQRRKP
jgi:hypothetical protein